MSAEDLSTYHRTSVEAAKYLGIHLLELNKYINKKQIDFIVRDHNRMFCLKELQRFKQEVLLNKED